MDRDTAGTPIDKGFTALWREFDEVKRAFLPHEDGRRQEIGNGLAGLLKLVLRLEADKALMKQFCRLAEAKLKKASDDPIGRISQLLTLAGVGGLNSNKSRYARVLYYAKLLDLSPDDLVFLYLRLGSFAKLETELYSMLEIRLSGRDEKRRLSSNGRPTYETRELSKLSFCNPRARELRDAARRIRRVQFMAKQHAA